MADLAKLRALDGPARKLAAAIVRTWSNELDAIPVGDGPTEEVIYALLDAIGDMSVALLPVLESRNDLKS